jgi:hypothetical protein
MEHMSGGAAGHHHSKYGGEEKANSSALALHEAETKPSDLLGKVGLRCASVIMGYVLLGRSGLPPSLSLSSASTASSSFISPVVFHLLLLFLLLAKGIASSD